MNAFILRKTGGGASRHKKSTSMSEHQLIKLPPSSLAHGTVMGHHVRPQFPGLGYQWIHPFICSLSI